MRRIEVLDFLIYRWRYGLGYIAVSIVFIALIIMAGFFVPHGITSQEQVSTVASAQLSLQNFSPDMVVNLPYHVLQKVGFLLFGVGDVTIKLPSLLLAGLTALGLLLLLRVWFKQNVAVLASLVGVTTGPFLFFAQQGSPSILYIFFPTWILLAASMIARESRHQFFWKIILFSMVALSLYAPMSAYVIVALLSAIILHPHLRQMVIRLPRIKLAVALISSLVVAAPIIYALLQEPELWQRFLGISHASFNLQANLSNLASRYLDFVNPSSGLIMKPVYELAALLLVGLGIYRIFSTKYTARSYILVAWIVLIIPVLVLSPGLTSITFVPFLLLLAFGIDLLIRYWYRLFPQNPYARVAGLVPLVILVGSLTLSGVDRFYFGYTYGDDVKHVFSRDLSLLRHWQTEHNSPTMTIVTSKQTVDFYRTVARYNPTWRIQSVTTDTLIHPDSEFTTYAHKIPSTLRPDAMADVVVGSAHTNADRFYIYKSTAL